jgi:putative membrane protein
VTRKEKRVLIGAATGLIGGLVGAFVMNEFQIVAGKLSQNQDEEKAQTRSEQSQEGSDDATMKAADRGSRALLHRRLSEDEKKKLGPVVHYAFGGVMGALYCGLAAVVPATAAGFGTAFGVALFVLADETAVPLLGLSKAPTAYPLSSHAMALASHLVWATSTEAVRRIVA